MIFAGGGDDTVREVLQGASSRDFSLGIIPLGTFNNIAGSIGLPTNPVEAFELALNGTDHYIDLGKIENGPYFIESVGVGIDADTWQMGPKVEEKTSLKRWIAGLKVGMFSLVHFKPKRLSISIDNKLSVNRVMQVTIANSGSFASGIHIAPMARLDDGLLDVCIIGIMSKAKFLSSTPLIFFGRHLTNMEDIRYVQCQKILITSTQDSPVRVDGLVAANLPLRVHVLPRALRIRVPLCCLEPRPPEDAAADSPYRLIRRTGEA